MGENMQHENQKRDEKPGMITVDSKHRAMLLCTSASTFNSAVPYYVKGSDDSFRVPEKKFQSHDGAGIKTIDFGANFGDCFC
jgi:hypothetical protein